MSSIPIASVPSVLVASPAAAGANNGHWHTALRWSRMLRGHFRTEVAERWNGEPFDLLIALHARRSAPSIAAWAKARPGAPLVVALAGTDVYRDLRVDAAAQRALQLASHLVAPHEQAPLALGAAARAKCRVVHASARPLRPLPPPKARLRAIVVGHLRDEKDPQVFLRAARRLRERGDIEFQHVGEAREARLAAAARRTAAEQPQYRWFGNLPRGEARQRIRHAQLLVSPARIEGACLAVAEAAQSGTAVIASHIPAHVGLLGPDHPGFFEVGDDAALALLIERARDEASFLTLLTQATAARAALFDPGDEQRRLVALVRDALAGRPA